ncbi:MAG: hypothetical protein JNL58_10105 [Planctomyces sp.]|nr:hypothetical protein [Planctomyces sp.]
MMYCIQRLSLCDISERQIFLNDDETATIGTGDSVGLRLHNSFGFPTVCLKVWIEKNACIAKNMTGAADLVFLNGQPFYDFVQLEDGDAIQIGSDQFLFLVLEDEIDAHHHGPAQPFPFDIVSNNRESNSEGDPAFLSFSVNRSVVRHEPRDSQWSFEDFVTRIARNYSLIQFVDFQQAGLAPPEQPWSRSISPHNASFEAKAAVSLHVIVDLPLPDRLQLHRRCLGKNAAVWAVPLTDSANSVQQAQQYLPWMARPTILEMFLRQSPRDFCLELLKPFRAIILAESIYAKSWCVLSDSSLRPDNLLSGSQDLNQRLTNL